MINQGKACPYCSVDPQCSHRQDTVSPFRAVEDPPCDDGGPGRGCRRQILHHPGSIPAVPPKGVLVFPAPRGSGRSPAGCGPMVPFSKTSGGSSTPRPDSGTRPWNRFLRWPPKPGSGWAPSMLLWALSPGGRRLWRACRPSAAVYEASCGAWLVCGIDGIFCGQGM